MLTISSKHFQDAKSQHHAPRKLCQRQSPRIHKAPSLPRCDSSDSNCCLFSVSGIPEDPLLAEEYYADTFDSCSEESEEQEEEMVFSETEGEMRGKGAPPAYRTNQQVPPALRRRCCCPRC